MIKIRGLVKSYGDLTVLDGIDLDIEKGEIIALLGSSGTGKSVLLRQIIGLEKPDAGVIEINGVDITALNEKRLLRVRRDIGYLFQEGALYDFMTVFENLAFPLHEHLRLRRQDIKNKVQAVLEMVDLHDVSDKYPSELSGGMRKRVGLARAIIMDAKVLLCDEPTSGLDPIRSRDISQLIHDVSRKLKCTTIMTSHDLVNAFRVSDRVAILNEGKIVALGTQDDIKNQNHEFVKEFIHA